MASAHLRGASPLSSLNASRGRASAKTAAWQEGTFDAWAGIVNEGRSLAFAFPHLVFFPAWRFRSWCWALACPRTARTTPAPPGAGGNDSRRPRRVGAGKTTRARLLAGVTRRSGGPVTVDGVDLARRTGRRLNPSRRAVQMILQDPLGSLNPQRSVGAMIARAAVLSGHDRSTARPGARDLLGPVGRADDAYHRKPSAFSGGQRQPMGVARALAMRPGLWIAEECVSALNVLVQSQILELSGDQQTEFGLTILDGPEHAYTTSPLAAVPGAKR